VNIGQQARGIAGGRCQAGPVEQQPGLGERRDGETVPGRDDLVVPGGTHAAVPCRAERTADLLEALAVRRVGAALEDRAPPLERARFCHAERLRRERGIGGPKDVAQFAGGPDVVPALLALAVRIQRGREAAFRCAHLTDHPVAGFPGDAAGQGRSRAAPQVRVGAGEQRVVVQHLLEVRHHPARVHGVPREAAAELVVHAAPGHRLHGALRHPQRAGVAGALVVPQQELTGHRGRELRRSAEAAACLVEVTRQARDGCRGGLGKPPSGLPSGLALAAERAGGG
jgi:hypothetical protein